jgi:hypothetical protein
MEGGAMFKHPIPLHSPQSRGPGKLRRPYLEPIAFPKDNPPFADLPVPQPTNFVLPLSSFASDRVDEAEAAGKLVFHTVGDTGGINGVETQEAVANAMEAQIAAASAPAPAFFYHLGDVIYYDGQSGFYGSQFYDPYQYYPREIVAIPGNHDGDTRVRGSDPPPDGPSLAGFMSNFCDSRRNSVYPYRQTMTQPYCWWVLDAPFVTIIGLYSNIEGTLDPRGGFEQQRFLETQLAAAPEKFLIIAVHHPPYSLDGFHGGTGDIASSIDRAMQASGRAPDLVLSGHVHSYQRFKRTLPMPGGNGQESKRTLPYIVDGAGGFANSPRALHKIQTNPRTRRPPANGTRCPSHVDTTLDLTIEAHNDHDPSFLRVTVSDAELLVEAFAVPFDGPPPTNPFDSVQIVKQG